MSVVESSLMRSRESSSKPGVCRHDVPERDRLRERGGDLEIEVAIDVAVEIELPLFRELHDGGPGKELARGPDAKEGSFGIDRTASSDVGIAVALGEERRTVLHHRHGRARDVLVAEVRQHDPVEERLELGAVAQTARRGRDRRRWRKGRRFAPRLGHELADRRRLCGERGREQAGCAENDASRDHGVRRCAGREGGAKVSSGEWFSYHRSYDRTKRLN